MLSNGYQKAYPKRLTWCKWEWRDPYNRDRYSTVYLSIYAPTWERPYTSVLISISNGGGRVFWRSSTVAALQQMVIVPSCYLERLLQAEQEAAGMADQIERDMRVALQARNLAPGGQVVRTDTGEIIAEAERIMRGKA